MRYRDEYILDDQTLRSVQQTVLDRLEAERHEYAQLVHALCPGLAGFLHSVEMTGNFVEGARLLPDLLANEGAREVAEHLTVEKLSSGVNAWRLRIRNHAIQGIVQHESTPTLADAYSDVALKVCVDSKSNLIDTEFFGWNDILGETPNPVDDPEKLHLLWRLLDNGDIRLEYAGFGTNEPYGLLAKSTQRVDGRPRYRVFDRSRGIQYTNVVHWQDLGVFNGDWSHVPAARNGEATEVEFVELMDGTYLCLSDSELACAGNGSEMRDWVDAIQETGQGALLRRHRARVVREQSRAVTDSTPSPSLESFVDIPSRDYVAYFASRDPTQITVQAAKDIRKIAARLGPERRRQYEVGLAELCVNRYADAAEERLPETVADFLDSGGDMLSAAAMAERGRLLMLWKRELERDLYYYGQDASVRMNRLRFAASMCFSGSSGSLYSRILAQAKLAISSPKSVQGQFRLNML